MFSNLMSITSDNLELVKTTVNDFAMSKSDSLIAQPSPLFIATKNNVCFINTTNYVAKFSLQKDVDAHTCGWAGMAFFSEINFYDTMEANTIAKFTWNGGDMYMKMSIGSVQILEVLSRMHSYTPNSFTGAETSIPVEMKNTDPNDNSTKIYADITSKGVVKAIRREFISNGVVSVYSSPIFLNSSTIKISDTEARTTNVIAPSNSYDFSVEGSNRGRANIGAPDFIAHNGLSVGNGVFSQPQYGLSLPAIIDTSKVNSYEEQIIQPATVSNITQTRAFLCSGIYFDGQQQNNAYEASKKHFVVKIGMSSGIIFPQYIDVETPTQDDGDRGYNIKALTVLNSFSGTQYHYGGSPSTYSTLYLPIRIYEYYSATSNYYRGISLKVNNSEQYLFNLFKTRLFIAYTSSSFFTSTPVSLILNVVRKGGETASITFTVAKSYSIIAALCLEVVNSGKDLSVVLQPSYKHDQEMILVFNEIFGTTIPIDLPGATSAGVIHLDNTSNEIIEKVSFTLDGAGNNKLYNVYLLIAPK
ncbi:MAG: hypothetical protein ACRCXT_00540 [Paraclostridium sp.]